jgi:hypothetical protein
MEANDSELELRTGGEEGYWHLICSIKDPLIKREARLGDVVLDLL